MTHPASRRFDRLTLRTFVVASLAWAGTGSAQVREIPKPIGNPAGNGPREMNGVLAGGFLEPGVLIDLHGKVSEWVRARKAPEKPLLTSASITAVAVSIQAPGGILARGESTSEDHTAVWKAAVAAIEDFEKKLPEGNDLIANDAKRELAMKASVTIEVSGDPIPIFPTMYAEADTLVSMGVDGVGARRGNKLEVEFPEAMLVRQLTPGQALAGCASRLLGDPTRALPMDPAAQPGKLGPAEKIGWYRVPMVVLGPPRPGVGPAFLFRGGNVIGENEITTRELLRAADGIANHLIARRWPGKEKYGVRGGYDAISGRFSIDAAPPEEQALVLMALRRYAETPGVSAASRAKAEQAWRELAQDLCVVEKAEIDPCGTPSDAMAVLAGIGPLCDNTHMLGEEVKSLHACVKRMLDGPVPDEVLGLRALAATTICDTRGPMFSMELARKVTAEAYAKTGVGHLPGQMPWLAFADLTSAEAGKPLASAATLREFRDTVYKYQVRLEDCDSGTRDLNGAIVFTTDKGRTLLASWQAARPVAALAMMLGDERVTPDAEFGSELSRLLPALRFLRQLCADEAVGRLYREPARAMWGVKAAPWDERMPGEASAVTLMAFCETVTSLEAYRARQKK